MVNENNNIVPPSDSDEKALCAILREILGTDSFGVTTDLFDMGLTSLGALRLITDAEKDGIKIDLVDIVEHRCVREILEALPEKHSEEIKADYAVSEARERALPHPVTTGWLNADASAFHWPYLMSFDLEVDSQRLCDALNKAVANSSVLSMIIEKDSTGQAIMRYDCSLTPHFEVQKLTEMEYEARRERFLQPFEMYGSPLIHAGVFETEKRVYLFLDIHHMIMDGIAMTLFCDDIEKAYRGEAMRQDTYCTWLAADYSGRERERSTAQYKESRGALQRFLDDDKTNIGFSPDISGDSHEIEFSPLGRIITKDEFRSLVKRFGVSEGLFCIGLASLAVAMVEGDGDCLGSTLYHNRGDDVSRNAFGSLFAVIPVVVKVREKSSAAAFFKDLNSSWTDSTSNIYAATDIISVWPGSISMLTTTFQSVETSGVGYLSSMGAKMEEIERVSGSEVRQGIQYIEGPDGGISLLLMFDKAFYSPEKLSVIQKALETVIDRLVAVNDPEAVTLTELLA